jgi:hypothetical protein
MNPEQPNALVEKMYPEIDISEVIGDWKIAKQWRENYTVDFPSLDNLADGVPVSQTPGSAYVGDTTIAGLVRAIPRDSLQQLPLFAAIVNGSKQTIQAHFASWILRKGVFNQDTFGKGLLSTAQIAAQQALTHGYAPAMTATGSMFDEFGTTMKVLHYADLDPEPGIQDFNEAGHFYAVANITKTRLKKIINAAKGNPKTLWNVRLLEKLAEEAPTGNNYSIYQSDPNQKKAAEQAPTYTFVTKLEVGRGGQFVTFCPQIEEDALRVVDNRSKFGFPRVQALVIDPAALSPFGVSRVRLASPWQNLMNAYLQNITSMLLLNSKPPILKRGRFTKPVQLKMGAVWEAQDQNAKAELITLDNGALAQFVPFAQQMAAQIQNIMGMPTGTVNGNSNAFGFSKTAPGVKMQERFQNSSLTQITNIVENFLRQYALVALDTYICEQMGEQSVIVDDECKNAINRIAEEKFVATSEVPQFIPPIGDDNRYVVNWDDYYRGKVKIDEMGQPMVDANGKEIREGGIETLSVEIELSIGKDELDEKKRGDLQDMLTVFLQNGEGNPAMQRRAGQITDMLLEKTVPESQRMSSNEMVTPQQPQQTEISPQVTMNS